MLNDLSTSSGRPWGFWSTFGFGIAVIAVFYISQVILGIILGIVFAATNILSQQEFNLLEITDTISAIEGLLVSLATITAAFLCTGLIIAIISMRNNISISEYLGLKQFSLKGILVSLAIVVVLIIANVSASLIWDRSFSTQVMINYYNTSIWPALFWIAFIIFAPIFEEIFFRGFLFKGFSHSRIGIIGTIILTSLGWTLLHQQYEVSELIFIFVLGISFGVIRYKTGSLWITLILHSFWNLVGIVVLALNMNGFFG